MAAIGVARIRRSDPAKVPVAGTLPDDDGDQDGRV